MRLVPPLAALLLTAAAVAAERPAIREPLPQDRILIVSPHPDDSELCCSGYVQRALARGAEVAVAVAWQQLALTEAERAAKLAALRWHGTQWEVMAPYMGSFVRANELFLTDEP